MPLKVTPLYPLHIYSIFTYSLIKAEMLRKAMIKTLGDCLIYWQENYFYSNSVNRNESSFRFVQIVLNIYYCVIYFMLIETCMAGVSHISYHT